MKIEFLGNKVKITGLSDFEPEKIFECGQCFRWNRQDDGTYIGVAYGFAACVRKEGQAIFISGDQNAFEAVWRSYFDLDRDYESIRGELNIGSYMRSATRFGAGLRILKQEPWEAMCSFLFSQCNNIARIKGIVQRFSEEFGDPFYFEGEKYYAFPRPERISRLTEKDLEPIRSGYRAKYVLSAARALTGGLLDFDAFSLMEPEQARQELIRLPGVGNKVADCILLYGLHKLDAFPVDVWMKRALAEHFEKDFDPASFGEHAGIAQQYIFYNIRENYKKAI